MKKRSVKLDGWQISFIEQCIRQRIKEIEQGVELHTDLYLSCAKDLLAHIEQS